MTKRPAPSVEELRQAGDVFHPDRAATSLIAILNCSLRQTKLDTRSSTYIDEIIGEIQGRSALWVRRSFPRCGLDNMVEIFADVAACARRGARVDYTRRTEACRLAADLFALSETWPNIPKSAGAP